MFWRSSFCEGVSAVVGFVFLVFSILLGVKSVIYWDAGRGNGKSF